MANPNDVGPEPSESPSSAAAITRYTRKIFVGFRTATLPTAASMMPTITPSRVLKDKDKIAAAIEEKKQAFLTNAANMPYTGLLEEICLIDPAVKSPAQWIAKEGKTPPSVSCSNYLMREHPGAWGDDTHAKPWGYPRVVFFGFEPRLFLKMLGLEVSMPAIARPLPPMLWYNNTEHRDISEAVLPSEFSKYLDIVDVVKARRPPDPEGGEAWDALLDGWDGPGKHPYKDAHLAFELAVQLGFVQNAPDEE